MIKEIFGVGIKDIPMLDSETGLLLLSKQKYQMSLIYLIVSCLDIQDVPLGDRPMEC